MAFEKIEKLVMAGRAGLPASATLSSRGGGRPQLKLAIQKVFLEGEFKIMDGERFDLLLGKDDDVNCARLARNADGLVRASIGAKGGATFYCGYIERFGDDPAEREFCAAKVIDKNTVQIALPAWEE